MGGRERAAGSKEVRKGARARERLISFLWRITARFTDNPSSQRACAREGEHAKEIKRRMVECRTGTKGRSSACVHRRMLTEGASSKLQKRQSETGMQGDHGDKHTHKSSREHQSICVCRYVCVRARRCAQRTN